MMTQVVYAIPLCSEGFTNFLLLAVPKTVHSGSSVVASERLTDVKHQTGSSNPVAVSSRPVGDMSEVCLNLNRQS